MDAFLVALLNGLVYGLLVFMVSAGLTLVFGMMGVLNFAHASFYMLGAYAAFLSSRYLGFWAGVLVATLFVAAIGLLSERLLLRRVRTYGHTQELLLTYGLFFVIEEIVKLIFGPTPVPYRVPDELRFTAFTIGQSEFPFFRVLMGGTALAMFLGIYAVLGLTRIGLVVRAAVEKPYMVSALGHNVPIVFSGLFAVGAGLAGLAGAIAGMYYPTSPAMAHELGTIIFVVVVIGGLGSLNGALAASLLIGVMTSFAVGVEATFGDMFRALGLPGTGLSGFDAVEFSSIAGVLPYALMLFVLLWRPAGFAGSRS
jgi:branched-chain amino acid transport system permease protein